MAFQEGSYFPRAFRVEERRGEILRILEEQGGITVEEICQACGISAVTARADLNALEQRGRLRRVHGGALPLDRSLTVVNINQRMSVNTEAKARIGARAAQLVQEGDSIIVDSGSTTYELVRALDPQLSITVVTHDLTIADYVEAHLPQSNLILLGGALRPSHDYCCGPLTLSMINQIFADKVFLATNSFSPEYGFMTEYEPAAEVKSAILSHGRERIMLMDSSKVGLHSFMRFATPQDIDVLVVDKDPNRTISRAFSSIARAPELIIA